MEKWDLITFNSMDIIYTQLINYGILIITQFTLGKKGAFLYALLLKMNLYMVSVVIIISDIFLMVLLGRLFQATANRVFPFTILQRKVVSVEQKLKESNLAEKIIKIGKVGILIITAVPFMGGVWSGMALSKIIQLDNKQAYWLTGIGTIIGCAIFLLAAKGFINLL